MGEINDRWIKVVTVANDKLTKGRNDEFLKELKFQNEDHVSMRITLVDYINRWGGGLSRLKSSSDY